MNEINTSFADFLKGYECPMCLEIFEVNSKPNKPNKQPTQLSCNQHNICMDCFNQRNFNLCPLCRKPVTFSADPQPNSQIISAIDTIKKVWEAKNSPLGIDNSINLVVKKPASMEIDQQVPESFECISFAEARWQYKSVGEEIATILPSIVQVMQWQSVAQELLNDFQESPKQWVLLVNHSNQESLGTAYLKPINNTQWESHWTAVKENDVALYLDLYKHLLAFVEKKKNNDVMDWRNVSLTTLFNYDNEEKWFNHIISFLQAHNIRYELVYIHRKFPNNVELHQAKLTTFPCKKEGHSQRPVILDDQKRLEYDMSFEEYAKQELNRLLETSRLNALFRFWAFDVNNNNNQESASKEMKNAFFNKPENFFVYTIEGKAQGFMRFERNSGNLNVISCKLLSGFHKYADHFIQQFIDWATTKPTYCKGTSAKKVKFLHPLPSVLLNAIEKNIEKIVL